MKNKDKLVKLKTGYTKVPNKALKLGLSSTAFHLLIYLIDCGESFNPFLSAIETRLGVSRPTLTRAFKELREHNVIKLLKRGTGKRPSEYEFTPVIHWTSNPLTDTQSVLRNRLMEKGRLVGGKENQRRRLGCPKGRHVDFIIPIVHDDVCGLNVPWNMDYLTFEEVMQKGSSFDGSANNDTWRGSRK